MTNNGCACDGDECGGGGSDDRYDDWYDEKYDDVGATSWTSSTTSLW